MGQLPSKLKWVNEAFSFTTQVIDDDKVIGELKREPFSSDVTAWLHELKLRFDVHGFLHRKVNIYDRNDDVIATLEVHMGRKATLHLHGETYLFSKRSFLSREWLIIHDLPNTDQDPEMVNYTTTRRFFKDEGEINVVEDSQDEKILLLTGLFLRRYFIRRRQKAGAVAAIAG
jgi:hypothetical protein